MKKIILLIVLLFSLTSCTFAVPGVNENNPTYDNTKPEETEEVTENVDTPITPENTPVTPDNTPITPDVPEKTPHTHVYKYSYNFVGHWKVCDCGDQTTLEVHKGGVATETEKAICEVCGTSYGGYKEPEIETPLPTPTPTPMETYTISFDNMGHGDNPKNLTEVTMIPYSLPLLEDELFEFHGWYLDESLTNIAISGTNLKQDITLYAKWTEINVEEPIDKFLITNPIFETRKLTNITEVTMDDFFNLGNRIDVKIKVSKEELDKLQADYETGLKSDIYRLASHVEIKLTNYDQTFTWEFENVGIRQKGNTSRRSIYGDNGDLNLNHYKLSFDETFDDPERYSASFINKFGNTTYKDREFLGMSGLDFKWDKNDDKTHIREIYSSYMYRASGILTPHIGLSTLSLIQTDRDNRETSMGLCTVFEPTSKSFIKRSLKSDVSYINMADWNTEKLGEFGLEAKSYGDLYKCKYGADLTNNSVYNGSIGVGNIDGSYAPLYDRKTHKDDQYDDKVLKDAINAISSGDYSRISKYVDLEYLAICEAVGFVVGNPDSMRYNDNNFMVYMRRTDGKMVFIPIDNDRCFGITKDWNPKDANMHLSMLDRGASNSDRTISLLLNTVLSRTSNPTQELYLEFCNKLKESAWTDINTFNTYYNKAKDSYKEYHFSLTSGSNVTFETYMKNKLNCISLNNNDNNDNNNNDNITGYNDVYFVSSINNWGNYSSNDLSKYKLQLINDDTYQISLKVTSVLNDNGREYIKFKFNNGYQDYSKIDWTLTEDLKTLVTSKGSSAKCYGVKVGDTITVTINIKTKEASVVINGN